MDHWFSVIASGCQLAANAVKELDDVGFVVIPGPVAPPQLSRLASRLRCGGIGCRPRRRRRRADDDASVGLRQSRSRLRWPLRLSANPGRVLPRHRCSVPLKHNARSRSEPGRTRAGPPRGLPAHDGRLADGRLHLHGGRVSARQRRHSLCARFAPLASCAERRDAGCDRGLRGTGIGVWSRGLSRHLQRLRLARTWREPDERAAAVDSRCVHPPRRQTRDEPSGSDASRNACAYWSPCQVHLEHRA